MAADLVRSRYVVTSDRVQLARTCFDGYVVFSTRTGVILAIAQPLWERVQLSRHDELPEEARAQLIMAKVLVPTTEDELGAVLSENLAAIAANEVLYQVLQPTAWCQLACSYCGQAHSRQRLSKDNQQFFLSRMRERLAGGRYSQLKIGWFGGEPLAGMEVIRTLTPRARALAQEFGCDYSARIVTNGLALTPALARELVEQHSVGEAEITLDGLTTHHDRQRFTKTGKGSFARIFTNLIGVSTTTQMRLVVRCNVSRDNADGVLPLLETLAAAGLAKAVRFYTSPVYAWGNDANASALGNNEYAEREMEWIAAQVRLGFSVGLVPPRRPIVCMSVQRDAEVVDAFGTRFNCTEVPYVPAYGQPNIYRINDDTRVIPIHPAQASPAQRLSTFNQRIQRGEQPACANCAMLPVCGGQCPKTWQEGHEPCPSAKHNMRDRLAVLFALAQTAQEDHAFN